MFVQLCVQARDPLACQGRNRHGVPLSPLALLPSAFSLATYAGVSYQVYAFITRVMECPYISARVVLMIVVMATFRHWDIVLFRHQSSFYHLSFL